MAPFGTVLTADGVRLRYAHWKSTTARARGTMLVAGGRSEFIEKYFETIEDLRARGFQVFCFDWRGQGLSQRLLKDSEKGYIEDYAQYLRDLDAMLHQVVYPLGRQPLVLLAHSMGAHIALRYVQVHEHRIARLVLSAPMLDIYTDPLPRGIVRRLSRAMVRWGFAQLAVAGSGRHHPFRQPFVRNRLTSDASRFARTLKQVEENPALSAAQVTYGWLAATYDAIDALATDGSGRSINLPVLIAVAGKDRVVRNAEIENLARGLRCCEMVTIAGARHEILQEQDPLRSQFWRAFDAFMGI